MRESSYFRCYYGSMLGLNWMKEVMTIKAIINLLVIPSEVTMMLLNSLNFQCRIEVIFIGY